MFKMGKCSDPMMKFQANSDHGFLNCGSVVFSFLAVFFVHGVVVVVFFLVFFLSSMN